MRLSNWEKGRLRHAADSIAVGYQVYGCRAITNSSKTVSQIDAIQKLKEKFAEIYAEDGRTYTDSNIWFGVYLDPQNQMARTLALLLMAELNTGELP